MRYRVLKFLIFVWVGCLLAPFSILGADVGKAVLKEGKSDLKEQPDSSSDTIVRLGKGEAVLVVLCLKDTDSVQGVEGHWCLIRYRGVEGWVFDSAVDSGDPRAEASYKDVPSISEEIGKLDQLRESHKLEDMELLSALVINQIEQNFSRKEINASARLSSALLGSFSARIEALVYLHRFDEARKAYAYLMKSYPGIRLEDDLTTAQELLQPYMVFIEFYGSAPVFDNPSEPMKKVKAALAKRDLSLVSKLAIPGIFELWVAHTDWVMKLGDRELDRQEWLSSSWDTSWEVKKVSTRIDDLGNLIGYCIATEPWNLNYYEIKVNRVDFCVDRLPDGTYAFSYLTLYTEPIR